ncbi:MAG TPA: helix-turn-helix transcriptional regulator [Vicinamibacterales bacterium]|nr:helix-turn-helix transcriptional regulator [Vicinamibacterales bacterium]
MAKPKRLITETVTKTKGNPAYLRQAREQAGVSLRAMARAVGYSAPYVSDLERGHRELSPTMLDQFEEAITRLRVLRQEETNEN